MFNLPARDMREEIADRLSEIYKPQETGQVYGCPALSDGERAILFVSNREFRTGDAIVFNYSIVLGWLPMPSVFARYYPQDDAETYLPIPVPTSVGELYVWLREDLIDTVPSWAEVL